MTKDQIIQKFLGDDKLNVSVYATDARELGLMYDVVRQVQDSDTPWQDFLQLEGALSKDGRVRFDKTVSFYSQEDKKNYTNYPVIFKFPVYNWLKSQIELQQAGAAAVSWNQLLEGNTAAVSNLDTLKFLGKGLKAAIVRLESGGQETNNAGLLLRRIWNKYKALKNKTNEIHAGVPPLEAGEEAASGTGPGAAA